MKIYAVFHYSILWDFAKTTEEFAFKSIQEVLEENEELKAEVKYLRDALETNITEIYQVLADLKTEQGKTSYTVGELEVKTKSNTDSIKSNSEQIQGNTIV